MSRSKISDNLEPNELRGILRYIPQFRNETFVIALDGSVAAAHSFQHVLADIAVLKSLHIHVVLVYGIGRQMKDLSKATKTAITDAYGEGTTDAATLKLAQRAASHIWYKIRSGLVVNDLVAVDASIAKAESLGIIGGVDQQYTGKLQKLNLALLKNFLVHDMIPVFGPILPNREGKPLRVNSDQLAAELAIRLNASKLIFLTKKRGIIIDKRLQRTIPYEELTELLEDNPEKIEDRLLSKAKFALYSLEHSVPRIHILDGNTIDAILTEVFDSVGIGTMIHANEYQQIRHARRKDLQGLYAIIKNAARRETLRYRTKQSLEKTIDHFYVYEIDESIIGCIGIVPLVEGEVAELSAVLVQSFYHGKGVGKKMVEFACIEAHRMGFSKLVALSTQSSKFFIEVCGFEQGFIEDLPEPRRQEYEDSGRNSKIMVKNF